MRLMYISILFYVFSFTQIYAQGNWVKQNSPTSDQFYKAVYTDTTNIWVCGGNGTIIHTSNGGLNWFKQNTNTDFQILSMSFINNRLGWAIANKLNYANPVIYKTTNGGNNWNYTDYPDTNLIFYDICFLDSLYGFISGNSGLFLRTTNGGLNWRSGKMDTTIFSNLSIRNIFPVNKKIIYGCGGQMDIAGMVWKSEDSGKNFTSKIIAPEPITKLIKLDSVIIIGTGGDYEFGASLVKTTSSGLNWIYDPIPYFGIGFDIAVRTKTEWWIGLGFSNMLTYTTNSGINWNSVQMPDSSGIYQIIFPDSLHGWAFGTYGSIYRYYKTTSSVTNNENNLPKTFKLNQNYPNPFNSSTIIRFSLPENGKSENGKWKMESGLVTLKVFDILGKEIAILVNEKLRPGTYEKPFSNNHLPSGIYFYQLLYENKIIDAKIFVILK